MAISTRPERRKLFQTLSREPSITSRNRVFAELSYVRSERVTWSPSEAEFDPPAIQIHGTAANEQMICYKPAGAISTYTFAVYIAEESGGEDISFGTPVEQVIVDQLAWSVGRVPAVEFVCVKGEKGFYRVWTILDKRDESTDEAIYAAEAEVLDFLPRALLDFTVLHRMGRPLSDVLPHGSMIVYRRT